MSDPVDVRAVLTRAVPVDLRGCMDEYHWLSNQKYRGAETKEALNEAFVALVRDPERRVRGAAICWFAQNRYAPAGSALLSAWLDEPELYVGVSQDWLPDGRDLEAQMEIALRKCAGGPPAVEAERSRRAALQAREELGLDAAEATRLLRKAAWAGDLEAVQRYATAGGAIGTAEDELVGPPWRFPLHAAAQQGHTAVVRWLVARGAWVDAPDGDRYTPLLIAVDHGRVDAVAALVELGASVERRAADGSTPLSAAGRHADREALLAALGRPR